MGDEAKQEFVTEQYHGPTFGCEHRALWEYAVEIKNGTGLNVYDEIKSAISRAKEAGRCEVVILDLGCGEEWQAFSSLFPGLREETVKYYPPNEQEPKVEIDEVEKIEDELSRQNMGLTVIGLTDAKKGEHNRVLFDNKEGKYKLKKVGFTLSEGQTLQEFLRGQVLSEYGGVDLILSIQLFEYLNPEVFRKTLEAARKVLFRGGKMIAVGIDPSYKKQDSGGLAPFTVYTPEEIQSRKEMVRSLGGKGYDVKVFEHDVQNVRNGANCYNSFTVENR